MPGRSRIVLAGAALLGAVGLATLWLAQGGDGESEPARARTADPAVAGESRGGASPPFREDGKGGERGAPGPRPLESREPPDGLPAEVAAAARGEPDGARVRGEPPGPMELRIEGEDAGGNAFPEDDASRGADPAGQGDPPAARPRPTEEERRAVWTDRQKRRNRLRVEVLTGEFELDAREADELAGILDSSLSDKIGLYSTLDPQTLDERALSEGLERIRTEENDRLIDLLGRERYAAYQQMEDGGRFVLPDEKKIPEGR